MISERKKYITKIFIKKCTVQNMMKSHMEFSLSLLQKTYPVSEDVLSELKKKYNIDEYIERLMPLLDQQFTIGEMQEAIKFYSTGVGKKMVDLNFLREVGKVGNDMFTEIEQEFALRRSPILYKSAKK